MRLRTWTRRPLLVQLFVVALIADLGAGAWFAGQAVAATATAPGTTPASAAAAATDSARTIAWADAVRDLDDPNAALFADLEVTVSQTANLTNQGVTVSWTGARPTSLGEFATDYLQLMQCWGDASGPSPEQCQFGQASSSIASRLGTNAAGRGLVAGEDPQQVYDATRLIPPPRNNPNLRAYAVPFRPVKGEPTFDATKYFDANTSNEVSAARTGADGTGQVVFETQTSLEAPQLGCGAVDAVSGTPRSCWLVIVPRGGFDADGSPASSAVDGRISGSPLSSGNWQHRIQVPLAFQRIGSECALGAAERRTAGSELVAEAITSWQPALCAKGPTFGYSQIGDAEARRQLTGSLDGAAGMAFVSRPLSAEESAGATVAYAPVTASALVVAFNIEWDVPRNSPMFGRNGTLVDDLTLSPRLLAKLLTQSYRADVPDGSRAPMASNPRTLVVDPEFVRLNPAFADFNNSVNWQGMMVALGSSDANAEVWRWIVADADARDFLQGRPDEWGMQINPAYAALAIADDPLIDSFPKADLSTFRPSANVPEPGYGTLDLRPYMNDLHEAALRARRADANVKIVWDDTKVPPGFVASGPQIPGARFSMALTDSASAARYGLQTAKLVNAAGKAVAPTQDGILAAMDAMVPSAVPGVELIDQSVRANRAYPLGMVAYAAVNICTPTLPELKDYAGLLDYAAATGQVSGDAKGQLPRGYVPLPEAAREQVAAAATQLRAEVSSPKCAEHLPGSTPETPETIAPEGEAFVPEAPVEEPAAETPAAPEPDATTLPVDLASTDGGDTGPVRYAYLAALLFALPLLLAGPLLLRRSASLGGAA